MSPDTLAEIFTLFVSTKGARGTGLGLTVSRKILREHGGDIHAQSEPGRGSAFVLEFPLLGPDAAGSPAGATAGGIAVARDEPPVTPA
jgi:signal transduction histidine kinase